MVIFDPFWVVFWPLFWHPLYDLQWASEGVLMLLGVKKWGIKRGQKWVIFGTFGSFWGRFLTPFLTPFCTHFFDPLLATSRLICLTVLKSRWSSLTFSVDLGFWCHFSHPTIAHVSCHDQFPADWEWYHVKTDPVFYQKDMSESIKWVRVLTLFGKKWTPFLTLTLYIKSVDKNVTFLIPQMGHFWPILGRFLTPFLTPSLWPSMGFRGGFDDFRGQKWPSKNDPFWTSCIGRGSILDPPEVFATLEPIFGPPFETSRSDSGLNLTKVVWKGVIFGPPKVPFCRRVIECVLLVALGILTFFPFETLGHPFLVKMFNGIPGAQHWRAGAYARASFVYILRILERPKNLETGKK